MCGRARGKVLISHRILGDTNTAGQGTMLQVEMKKIDYQQGVEFYNQKGVSGLNAGSESYEPYDLYKLFKVFDPHFRI